MSNLPSDDIELDKFIARVEFFESCVEQLKREIPKYLNKQHELDKSHRNFAKTLRGVASSEPNQKLRDLIFNYSEKHEELEKEREIFGKCGNLSHELVDGALKLIILPVKDIIADQKSMAKIAKAGSNTQGSTAKLSKSFKSDLTDADFVVSTLQVHAKMFEKHRLQSMRALLKNLLDAELRYHCKVVEDISSVLHDLELVNDDDP